MSLELGEHGWTHLVHSIDKRGSRSSHQTSDRPPCVIWTPCGSAHSHASPQLTPSSGCISHFSGIPRIKDHIKVLQRGIFQGRARTMHNAPSHARRTPTQRHMANLIFKRRQHCFTRPIVMCYSRRGSGGTRASQTKNFPVCFSCGSSTAITRPNALKCAANSSMVISFGNAPTKHRRVLIKVCISFARRQRTDGSSSHKAGSHVQLNNETRNGDTIAPRPVEVANLHTAIGNRTWNSEFHFHFFAIDFMLFINQALRRSLR